MSSDSGVVFRAASAPPRLRVTDTVGGREFDLRTSAIPDPTPVNPDGPVPVERGVRIETTELAADREFLLFVRDADGQFVASVDYGTTERFDAGHGYLELETPVKTYVRVDDPFTVDRTTESVRITFDRPTTVTVSARAWRRRPTETVTVATGEDDAPEDAMRALSLFGTGHQTTSPERSFPTLRGHPPAISLGNQFGAPDGLTPPDTGVVVETPSRLESILPVAPLAYYLGGTVEGGPAFAVRADGRTVHRTDAADPSAVATAARRTLERTFVLDCAVRTAGLYPVDLEAARELKPLVQSRLDADLETVYGWSLARRVAAAFELPYEPLAAQAPVWPHVGYVEPTPSSLPALPSLVNALAPIRTVDPPRVEGPTAAGRIASLSADGASPSGATRSISRVVAGEARYADLTTQSSPDDIETDARRRVWVGADIPIGANEHLEAAATNRHRAERNPTEPPMEVAVVSNEARMDGELESVHRRYGDRSDRSVSATVYRRLSRRQLRHLLESDVDFLHFVGHATPTGLGCPDGELDVAAVAETGVTAFCLNACQSYTQGRRLVDAGALGGVVTHGEVDSHRAHAVGATLARLLNAGFPLAAALDIVGETHSSGGQYAVVGGGGVSITQSGSGPPNVWRVTATGGTDAVRIRPETYAASMQRFGVGAFQQSVLADDDEYHLVPGDHGPFGSSVPELRGELDYDLSAPLLLDGQLHWTDGNDLEAVFDGSLEESATHD